MPQGRIILKSISQSKKLSELKTDGARLLYTWLIPSLDIEGRFSGDEQVISGQIFTRLEKTSDEISNYLADLARVGLIIWYETDNDKYLEVPDFAHRQPSLNPSKEAKSSIPPPTPEQAQSSSCPTPPKVKQSKVKLKKSKVNNYVQEIFTYWNSQLVLPSARLLTPKRKTQLKTRLGEKAFESNWREIIDKIASSKFCTGQNGNSWKATFDWLIKNQDNYTKVLEGNYDERKTVSADEQEFISITPETSKFGTVVRND